jgi:indole-3-glycerol phosphate synthase
MKDMLRKLADNSQKAIDEGIYDINYKNEKSEKNLINQDRKSVV